MIHNRQAANIQRQTQNACKGRHLRGSRNHTAAQTPPVSLPQKAEQPEHQTGTRQEAHLHMQTTCQASACKVAITAIKAFQATGTVAREGRHSARLSATMAGL